MLQPTRLISTPFAQEGDKTEIQNVTGEFDNSATYRLGFPPLTMQSIRLGGKPPKGTDFNGVLFDITENISFLCKGGRYQYNAGLSTLIGGYPEGSNLLLDDNVTEVVSTVAGNQNNPNINMTGWILKPNKTTAVNVADASGETQQQVNYNGGAKWHSRVGGYLENERVVLANGDIVRSTIDGNVNDPNVNMNGWVKTNSASRVFDASGVSQQVVNDNFVTPEMFGAVANSWETDNTAALNAAFATGKDVYSTPDKVYTCNGNLRTQGQRCVGGWKIRSSKTVVGGSWTNTSNTYPTPCDFAYLQGVYCAYAYDLAELFAIRDLGYNTLLHYGGMHINGYDDDGTVQNLLDNAKTAGLQVFLGTQNSLNGMSLTDFVNTHKNHHAVLGFLIADEPTHNGITVAQQATNIATVKALTNKPVAVSDFTFDAFTEVLADGYDYIFGDIYNDLGATKQQTLYKMRAWLGITSKRHPNSKVLPAVMGFKYGTGVPIADIIETSKVFARSCGGNFACFIWDGLGDPSISNSIRDTAALQDLSKEMCAYKTNVYSIPECYAWGSFTPSSQVNYSLSDILKHQVQKDPNSVDIFKGINSSPVLVVGGAVNGDRVSTDIATGAAVGGIWFKGAGSAFCSDIKMRKYNRVAVISGKLGGITTYLNIVESFNGGYNLGTTLGEILTNGGVTDLSFETSTGGNLFCIKYDSTTNVEFYRTYVRGVYITSDW